MNELSARLVGAHWALRAKIHGDFTAYLKAHPQIPKQSFALTFLESSDSAALVARIVLGEDRQYAVIRRNVTPKFLDFTESFRPLEMEVLRCFPLVGEHPFYGNQEIYKEAR